MTTEGHALLTTLLLATTLFIQNFVCFIDKVYHKLLASSFSDVAVWSLATALGAQISTNVAYPYTGIINILQLATPIQVASLIFHTYLKCYVVMKAYNDAKFASYPNISSKYIKFLAHNT